MSPLSAPALWCCCIVYPQYSISYHLVLYDLVVCQLQLRLLLHFSLACALFLSQPRSLALGPPVRTSCPLALLQLILQVHFALDSAPLGSSRCFSSQLHNKIVHGPNRRGCRHLPTYESCHRFVFNCRKTEMWVQTDNLARAVKIF